MFSVTCPKECGKIHGESVEMRLLISASDPDRRKVVSNETNTDWYATLYVRIYFCSRVRAFMAVSFVHVMSGVPTDLKYYVYVRTSVHAYFYGYASLDCIHVMSGVPTVRTYVP